MTQRLTKNGSEASATDPITERGPLFFVSGARPIDLLIAPPHTVSAPRPATDCHVYQGVNMCSMTEEQRALLDRRRAAFDDVIAQLEPSLIELADHLGLEHPDAAMRRLDAILSALDLILPRLDFAALGSDELLWLHTRLLYFVGAWLVEKFEGRWLLQDDPESEFFMRFVVGGFERCSDPSLMVDPLELTLFVLESPETHRLSTTLAGVCE